MLNLSEATRGRVPQSSASSSPSSDDKTRFFAGVSRPSMVVKDPFRVRITTATQSFHDHFVMVGNPFHDRYKPISRPIETRYMIVSVSRPFQNRFTRRFQTRFMIVSWPSQTRVATMANPFHGRFTTFSKSFSRSFHGRYKLVSSRLFRGRLRSVTITRPVSRPCHDRDCERFHDRFTISRTFHDCCKTFHGRFTPFQNRFMAVS